MSKQDTIKALEYKIDFLTREIEDLKQEFRSFYYQNLNQEDLTQDQENDFN